jgi:hypothetical protein
MMKAEELQEAGLVGVAHEPNVERREPRHE